MLCLPKSLSYERFCHDRRGTEALLSSGVCVCVCQTYVLTAKTTTFNGTLTVDRAALLPVFLFVCTSEGKAFLLCHTEGLRAENNCSSLGRGDIRDFCRGVFVFYGWGNLQIWRFVGRMCDWGHGGWSGDCFRCKRKNTPPPQRHTHTYTHLSTVTGWRCEKRHLQPTCRKKALATPPLSKKHWVGQLLMLNKYTL